MDLKFEQELRDSFCIRHWVQELMDATLTERLNYHRILLIGQGTGTVYIDDTVYALSDYNLLLVSKGQVCRYAAGSRLSGFLISFGDCFWERSPASAGNCKAVLFNNAAANQLQVLSVAQFDALYALSGNLYSEYSLPDYAHKPDAMAAYLKIIMIKLANINIANLPEYDVHERQVYRRFTELVSTQYKSLHDVEAYARQMNITARRLSECCRKCAGKGAKEIINGQLVAEAKRALQFSALPVKEIAYGMNFSTPEQFSHFFRKHTGSAPLAYRNCFVKIGR